MKNLFFLKSNAGFTIIELLATLFIAVGFLYSGYQLYSLVLRDSNLARSEAIASNVAKRYLLQYSDNLPSSCVASNPISDAGIPTTGISNVLVSVAITCPYSARPSVSKITITVTYNTPQATIRYATYVDKSEPVVVPPPPPAMNAVGGNEIKEIGGYRYHIFTQSGSFSPNLSGTFNVILIGGGAGGSGYVGGGGGQINPQTGYNSVTLTGGQSYNVVVGGASSATSFAGLTANGASGGTSGSGRTAGSSVTGNDTYGGGGVPLGRATGSGGGGGGSQLANGGNASNGVNSGTGGTGATGQLLVSMDTNLTSANFSTFTGMTVVSSGGGGGAGWADPGSKYFDPTGGDLISNYAPGSPGAGGTGAGTGGTHSTAYGGAPRPTNGFSWGSGGGGGAPGAGVAGGLGEGGLAIIRYPLGSNVTPPSAVSIVASGSTRTWSNGDLATSCNDYRNPVVYGYNYAGATGDGVYRIDPDRSGSIGAFNAYCDMTGDGGGWTLMALAIGGSVPSTSWATSTAGINIDNSSLNSLTFRLSDAVINLVKGTKAKYTKSAGIGTLYFSSSSLTFTSNTSTAVGNVCTDIALSAGCRTMYYTDINTGPWGSYDAASGHWTSSYTATLASPGSAGACAGARFGVTNYPCDNPWPSSSSIWLRLWGR